METLESRKIHVIQRILGEINDPLLSQIESLIGIEEEVREKLESRALKAEESIKSGRVFTIEEV